MSAAARDLHRQVIPRWRALSSTIAHHEMEPVKPIDAISFSPSDEQLEGLNSRVREFEEQPSLSFAADLLSASLVMGPTPRTLEAAQVVADDPRAPAMARDTATAILNPGGRRLEATMEEEAERRRQIHELRMRLRGNPRNAIRWAELARHYATEGHQTKAVSAMRLALSMAPMDRFILRGAVRLWVHMNEPDRAVQTLRAARDAVLNDPWLLASDIAASATAGRPSKHVKVARQMLEGGRHTPFSMSELTSALATLELDAGDARRARRLFRSALIDPNENSIAQAEWASQNMAGLVVEAQHLQRSPEARARDEAQGEDVDATLSAAWEWLLDQPFSAQPAIFGSYEASMHRRFEDGARFAAEGLRANPRDAVLLNNRAFCLACVDEWEEAERLIREAESFATAQDRPMLDATSGLIRFRAGDPVGGRRLYETAIEKLRPDAKARAGLILAAEEIRAGNMDMLTVAASLIEEARRSPNHDLRFWVAFVPSARP